MIKEALEFLQKAFTAGEEFKVIKGPEGSVSVHKSDGTVLASSEGHATREVHCLSFLDFVATIRGAESSIGFSDNAAGGDAAASIAVGSKSIEASLRAGLAQYEIAFPLEMTRPAAKLSELLTEKACEHKAFIKLLRTSLRGACDDDLHKLFGKVSFLQSTKTESTAERGRDSFGRSVDQALANATEIPESFVCRCNLFTGFDCEIEVEVFVFVDFDSSRFCLWVDSQAWATELEKVRRDMVKRLAEAFPHTPILVGEITAEAHESAPRFN